MTNETGMIDRLHYNEPIGKSHHIVLDWTLRCYETQSVICKEVFL